MMKSIAWIILTSLFLELCSPAIGWAITSGPTPPEAASFEPIGTTGMVNEFTGGFTYNLPLMDVPGPHGSGYPLSLAYHSNANPDDDATWVGFGWTLNPGAITRNTRGIPDDANGVPIEYINKQSANETFTIGGTIGAELVSNVVSNASATARWNTYAGFSMVYGFELDVFNTLSLRMNIRNGSAKFTADVNWAGYFQRMMNDEIRSALNQKIDQAEADEKAVKDGLVAQYQTEAEQAKKVAEIQAGITGEKTSAQASSAIYNSFAQQANTFIANSYMTVAAPAHSSRHSGISLVVRAGLAVDPTATPVIIAPVRAGVSGQYSSQKPFGSETVRSYGYLYEGNGSNNDMFDYGLERVTSYTSRDRFIHSVFNNHDMFSCNAQGIGGAMRLYHRSRAIHAPREQSSNVVNLTVGADVTVGSKIAVGASLGFGVSTNGIGPIAGSPVRREPVAAYGNNGKAIMRFIGDPSESVKYAANDRSVAYDVTSGVLTNGVSSQMPSGIHERLNNTGSNEKLKRPRSASSITFRTNREISTRTIGSDIRPFAYTSKLAPNERFIDRQEEAIADGIGEISTVSTAGVRYVFGLPVYGRNEESFTFMRGERDTNINLSIGVTSGGDKRLGVSNGTGQRRNAPIASSFLLTEVLTPDYIDRTMNGPTPDDFGGYTFFEYERSHGSLLKGFTNVSRTLNDWYRWRIPYQGFSFDLGSISDIHDDRASASMGFREQYFLSKISTKSHTAIFVTNMTDETIIVNGQPMQIKGSGRMRYDAFQAFNHVDDPSGANPNEWHSRNERVTAYVPGGSDINTYLDPDSSNRFIGRTLGGIYSNRVSIDATFVSKGSAEWRKNKMRVLEKIILLARNEDGTGYSHVIKTVNFEYDYSLGALVENTGWIRTTEWTEKDPEKPLEKPQWDTVFNMGGSLNSAQYLSEQHYRGIFLDRKMVTGCRFGKLTLKRVWTDYGMVKSARISPYEFSYTYPRSSATAGKAPNEFGSGNIIQDYEGKFIDAVSDWHNEKIQNPAYSFWSIDPWGSNRDDGWGANTSMRTHIDQQRQPGTVAEWRDAAAWQLKIISLPSGGRIRIHYERNTYSYVQDRRVETLVPLHVPSQHDVKKGQMTLNLGYLAGRNQLDVRKLVKKHCRDGKTLYFKLLLPYAKCGWSSDSDVLPSYGMEYIKGHARATAMDQGGNVRLALSGDVMPTDILDEFLDKRSAHPMYCKDGKALPQFTRSPKWKQDEDKKWVATSAQKFATYLQVLADAVSFRSSFASTHGVTDASENIIERHSYVRVPCVWKYGGGVRVKRILLEDPGLESGTSALYGTEYDYDTWDDQGIRISSGVATNEPASMREDCALVTPVVGRENKHLLDRMSSGEDIDQLEGPMAYSAWPSASIGYGRVVARSIVQTSTSPGYTINEFYTAKDFPVVETSTPIKTESVTTPPMPNPFINAQAAAYSASQGFSVVHNSMHGKHKSTKKCSGQYSSAVNAVHNVVEESVTEYFRPGEKVPVLVANGGPNSLSLSIERQEIGVDVDVAIERRRLFDRSISGSIPFDLGVSLPFIPVFSIGLPQASISNQEFQFASITKVVTYLAFEKRKTIRRDGMTHIVENVAFDKATGIPLVQSYIGEQDGNVVGNTTVNDNRLTFVVPAWMAYSQMDWSGYNESSVISGTLSYFLGKLQFTPVHQNDAVYLTPGDYVNIPIDATTNIWAHVESVSGGAAILAQSFGSVSIVPGPEVRELTIVRSGRTNQLTAVAGNLVELKGAPVVPNVGTIALNHANARIVNATATTYSDVWGHDDVSPQSPYVAEQLNDYTKGKRGKWRATSTYAYSSATGSILDNVQLARAGATNGGAGFSWVAFGSPRDVVSNWIKTSEVMHYSVHGEPVEQQDALGTPTSARFAHHDAVPSCVARNAEVGTATFLSFEDDASASSQYAHTGKKSLTINSQSKELCQVRRTARLRESGLLVRAWVRTTSSSNPGVVLDGTTLPSGTTIATINGWRLVEWTATAAALTSAWTSAWTSAPSGWASLTISTGQESSVDDVRVQPYTAEASCYVYDPATLRLVAQFDDQHFAVLYKYDAEGRLRRKERETERGLVPLQEHAMNTPTIAYKDRNTVAGSGTQPLRAASSSAAYPNSLQYGVEKAAQDMSPESSGFGAKGDVLNIRITPEKRRWKLFDNEEQDIPLLDSLGVSKTDSITPSNKPREKK